MYASKTAGGEKIMEGFYADLDETVKRKVSYSVLLLIPSCCIIFPGTLPLQHIPIVLLEVVHLNFKKQVIHKLRLKFNAKLEKNK